MLSSSFHSGSLLSVPIHSHFLCLLADSVFYLLIHFVFSFAWRWSEISDWKASRWICTVNSKKLLPACAFLPSFINKMARTYEDSINFIYTMYDDLHLALPSPRSHTRGEAQNIFKSQSLYRGEKATFPNSRTSKANWYVYRESLESIWRRQWEEWHLALCSARWCANRMYSKEEEARNILQVPGPLQRGTDRKFSRSQGLHRGNS